MIRTTKMRIDIRDLFVLLLCLLLPYVILVLLPFVVNGIYAYSPTDIALSAADVKHYWPFWHYDMGEWIRQVSIYIYILSPSLSIMCILFIIRTLVQQWQTLSGKLRSSALLLIGVTILVFSLWQPTVGIWLTD
jgi:hypothetical protein